jgi:hypothetical protein
VLGVDGASDFNALHSGKHNDEVQLYALDVLALNSDDLRALPLSMRKAYLERLLARRPDGIFISHFKQGKSGPTFSAPPATWDWRAWCRNVGTGLIGAAAANAGSRSRIPATRPCTASSERMSESVELGGGNLRTKGRAVSGWSAVSEFPHREEKALLCYSLNRQARPLSAIC